MAITFVGDWFPKLGHELGLEFPEGTVVANLECLIANKASFSDKAHSLHVDEEAYETIASSGISCLNLANNHVYDGGSQAFDGMVLSLKKLDGVKVYGTRDRPYAVIEDEGVRCAIIGCLEKCRARGPLLFPEEHVAKILAEIRGQFDRVIVTPHWGKASELASEPSPQQTKLALHWLQLGADAVVGHHSHTIQACHTFFDRPVYYSLGNFAFHHAASAPHPHSWYGLVATWQPLDQTWSHRFINAYNNPIEYVTDKKKELLELYFHRLSQQSDSANQWLDYWRWIRRVGPVFIPQHLASWRTRISKRPLPNTIKFCVWCMLPTTLAMAIGYLLPDKNYAKWQASVVEELEEL